MPSKERLMKGYVEEYLQLLLKENRSPATVRGYRYVLMGALESLAEAGLKYSPRRIGREEIDHLRHVTWVHVKPSTRRQSVSIFGTFLDFYGNSIVRQMHIAWPQDARVNVDWLEPLQALDLMARAQGVERIIVHLELHMGLRRAEVGRLRMQDINLNSRNIQIAGKGKGGPKWRTVPFHRDTMREVSNWIGERERIIDEARQRKEVRVPDNLLITYSRRYGLTPMRRTAMDSALKRAAERAGLECSHHTLRRTFGRMHWLAETRIETISALMGHADTRTTLTYLGVRLDDMQEAMDRMGRFEDNIRGTA